MSANQDNADAHVLHWSGKLLSADDLRKHWNSQRELVLSRQTLITPLALDELRATREELTEKVELLRGPIRGALWQARHEIDRSMNELKETVNGVRRILNPSHQLHGHPVAIIAVIITLRYFLSQWRKRESPLPSQ